MRRHRKEIIVPPDSQTIQRVWQLAAVLGFVLVVVLYKVWSLQVLENQVYLAESKRNYEYLETTPSQRGRILDRKGRVLVKDVQLYDVFINPRGLSKEEFRETIAKLRTVTKISKNYRGDRDAHGRYRVAKRVGLKTETEIVERSLEWPSVSSEAVPGRRYPHGSLAAHLLGYTAEIDKSTLERLKSEGYKRGDRIGRLGVEKTYEHILRGRDGKKIVQRDTYGRVIEELRIESEPQPGNDLVLSIDLDLQKVCEQVLGASRGSIIVNDPRTGQVLAMASNPRFDPNTFQRDYGKLLMDESHPLTHRAIQGLYPPASVFKLFEACALLERNILKPGDTVFCGGQYTLGNNTWKCHWKPGHGHADLDLAIEKSCDVFFYTMGRRLGINHMADWAEQFGLGKSTGIDLPSEKNYPFPCPANGHRPWYEGYTINTSIGQGAILVTPLETAVAVGALANATGTHASVFAPRVTLGQFQGWDADGLPITDPYEPVVLREIEGKPSTWAKVQHGAWLVSNSPSGTGRRCKVPGFTLAGKTGTAQHGGNKTTTHAWYVCWGPADPGAIPEIAITVLAEEAGHGGENASVLVPPILEVYLRGSDEELV